MPQEKTASSAKPKKVKVIRDSFCMPKDEYAEIDALKQRLLLLGKAVKKSELLRAGVLALSQANDASLLAYVVAVPCLKTGRPSMKLDMEPAPTEPPIKSDSTLKRAKPAAKSAGAAPKKATSSIARKTPTAKPAAQAA